MKHPKTPSFYNKYFYLITLLFVFNSVLGQSLKQKKMDHLSFMVGEWTGTSKVYKKGVLSKEVSAHQKINYNLDKSILVIELNSELLQLHTVIYYNETDEQYYYYPFSKNGVIRHSAEFKDGLLIVWSNKKNRYVFTQTSDGGLQEYGEQLVKGKWVKYFEDNFKNVQ